MSNDPNLSFGITLPFKRPCDLPDCQKATKRVYRVNVDDRGLSFCSNDHARTGITRWEEKRKLGIKPGMPHTNSIDSDEMTGDNMQEVEEKGV